MKLHALAPDKLTSNVRFHKRGKTASRKLRAHIIHLLSPCLRRLSRLH